MRAFGLACLGLVVGVLGGLAASEVIGIIGVVLFDRQLGIRFLPIVLGVALAVGLPIVDHGRRRR
jgi:hypothetical protein